MSEVIIEAISLSDTDISVVESLNFLVEIVES